MLRFALHRGRRLGNRDRQTDGKVGVRIGEATICGEAADPDELSGLARERLGDDTDTSVGRDDDLEGASCDRGIQRLAKMGVGMNVLDVGADFGNFVRPAMENRNRVSSLAQAVCEKRSAGTGTADDQSVFHTSSYRIGNLTRDVYPIGVSKDKTQRPVRTRSRHQSADR